MHNLTKTLAILLCCAVVTTASAQDARTIDLLLEQPGVSRQLEGLTSVPNAAGSRENLPVAPNAVPANTSDLRERDDVQVQPQESLDAAESVAQRYFRILTGELLDIYGAKEFAQQQSSELLFFNTIGREYRLAPGDVVRVTLRGLSQSNQSVQIGRDGSLILPDLPPISVSGLSIEEVEQTLLEALQYDDASASVFLSLETARLITVQISGAVSEPRSLAIPAYTPLSRVLAYAGGITSVGSLRNIVLRDREGNISEVDFYDFLQSPLGANDPLVTDSSRIFVANQGPTVAAFGFVARPGIYELAAGQTMISVRDLLALSGTSTLSPGLVLEAKYFDADGLSQTRSVTLDDSLNVGEVLNLRFLETRLQQVISVVGAVLDEYSIASNNPISVNSLLKGGATLTRDARLDFAMVLDADGSARAINLERAMQTSENIDVGSRIVIFDQQQFRRLVNADPNTSDDPLVAAVSQADVAELYLNGERLAFIPPDQFVGFDATLQPYYKLTPQTNLDLAIIEQHDGTTRSVSLRGLLQGNEPFNVGPDAKIHLYETTFLTNFVRRLDGRESLQDNFLELGNSAPLANLLRRSGVIRVNLDGALVAILPASPEQKISNIFDILGIEHSISLLTDFIEIQLQKTRKRPESFSLSLVEDFHDALPPATRSIDFWSKAAFDNRLMAPGERNINGLFEIGVSVFIDYELVDILSPSAFNSIDGPAAKILLSERIYPLYALETSFLRENQKWVTIPRLGREIVGNGVGGVLPGSKIYLFSRSFITTFSGSDSSSDADNFVQRQQEEQSNLGLDISEEPARQGTERIEAQLSVAAQREVRTGQAPINMTLLASSARFVGGAVQTPGFYPVAGNVRLSDLIDVAGGVLSQADLSRVILQSYRREGGSLLKGPREIVNLAHNSGGDVILKGNYSLDVSFLINEVATGLVTVSGEVLRPGQYIIGRADTVTDLVERAGGLSTVAYPLGAVFTRESIKEFQQENNKLLADQLRQAVLQVSVSGNDNAADQATAILGYSEQLRQQEANGRMSVNLTYSDPNAPVYLQDGDVLNVPKRPSHVMIIGAVNRDTVANYARGKTLAAYIAAAGGANREADLKRAYLMLPNGQSTPVSKDSPIPPGSAIVVPPRTDRLSVLGLTDLVSRVLGNIATSVLAINNVR